MYEKSRTWSTIQNTTIKGEKLPQKQSTIAHM